MNPPNSYTERQYFGEIPPNHQAAIDASWDAARKEQRDGEREYALSAYRAAFNAAPGDREDKHNAAYDAVFGAVTDLRFDLHEDVYVALEKEMEWM